MRSADGVTITNLPSNNPLVARFEVARSRRPVTAERRNATGSRTVTVQRCCNGCGMQIGDANEAELAAAVDGTPLPDVRSECPLCSARWP